MPDASGILKVSVPANGDVLLDGWRVTLHQLGQAMREGAKRGSVVWYYRENAGGEAPTAAMQVMQLIVANRLPVRLSAYPDYSDNVNAENSTLGPLFEKIREQAGQCQLVILRPDGQYMALPSVAPAYLPPQALAAVEAILPSKVKRNVAVIADTAWTLGPAPDLLTAGAAIPFFASLMEFGTIGHAVWVFDAASPAALDAGCRDADVLIVDSERLAGLPQDWHQWVRKAMRTPEILVHDRSTGRLRKFDAV